MASPSSSLSPSLSAGSHTIRQSLVLLNFFICFLLSPLVCQGWIIPTSSSSSSSSQLHNYCRTITTTGATRSTSLIVDDSTLVSGVTFPLGRSRTILASTAATATPESLSPASDDDDDEYEYVEYDILTETEFTGSEWMVGTVMDSRGNNIAETWVRLAVDRDGKNVAIWGDKSQGNWNFDTANQFLSVSKNALWGKNIWAGVIDDYYFGRGTVRGWNFFSPASVVGQWQAKRLGVEEDEAGVAPWFEEEDEDEEEEKASIADSSNTNEASLSVEMNTSSDSDSDSSKS
jgi:hypothetical protein